MDIKHNKNGMGGWTVITLAMALQSDRIHELCSNGVQKKRENFFFPLLLLLLLLELLHGLLTT